MVDITTLLTFRMDRLDRDVAIVDGEGKPTFQFQRKWQDTVEALVDSITLLADAVTAVQDAQAAADAANAAAAAADAAAAAADAAATAAQATADTVTADAALQSSYVTGATITATDAGADVTVAVSAHTRVYGDGTSVSVNAGNVTGLSYSTSYYIYYDQASRAGGAVTYAATTSQTTAAQTGDRHLVGLVTTPAALGGPVNGDGVLPPGVGNIIP